MKHHFLDHYSELASPIRSLDPRVKIVAGFALLFAVVLTPNGSFLPHLFFVPMIIVLILISRIPMAAILKKTLMLLPMILIIAASLPFMGHGRPLITFNFVFPLIITDTGLSNFASVIVKAVSAIWIMTLLTATTPFNDLMAGMQSLKMPNIFTSIFCFMYRYIFLFVDEAERMNIGRRSRSFGRKPMLAMKGFGWMVSSLFIRSFERSERVYQAMCARGFKGEFKILRNL